MKLDLSGVVTIVYIHPELNTPLILIKKNQTWCLCSIEQIPFKADWCYKRFATDSAVERFFSTEHKAKIKQFNLFSSAMKFTLAYIEVNRDTTSLIEQV